MITDDPARELRRVVDRCASYPLARWDRADADGVTPATRVHQTCQALADLAADTDRRPRRVVPMLRPHGLADQVSVLAHDALQAGADENAVASLLADLRRVL